MCSDVLRAGVRYARVPRPGDNAGPRPAGTRRTLYVYLLSVRFSLGKFGEKFVEVKFFLPLSLCC